MNRKRILSVILILAMLAAGCFGPASSASAAGDPAITVSAEEVFRSDEAQQVTVSVSLSGNPGIIAVLLEISYDPALVLREVNNGEVFADSCLTAGNYAAANPFRMFYEDSTARFNNTSNGTLFSITFEVPGGTEPGEFQVSVSYDEDDIYDVNLDNVGFEVRQGKVTVKPPCPHQFTDYVYNDDATCMADGTETAWCALGCGATDTRVREGSRIPHSFAEYVSNGDATCTEDGTRTAVCAYGCGTTDTVPDEHSALRHLRGEDDHCERCGIALTRWLKAAVVSGGIKLDWDKAPESGIYEVYRRTAGADEGWEKIAETSARTYKDTGVDVRTTYDYVVAAAFEDSNGAEAATGSFLDVPPSASYYKAVNWAAENGIVSGTSATTFSPGASCTRAQFALMLYRLAGKPPVDMSTNPFTDLPDNTGIRRAIVWAYNSGIVNGSSSTTFNPGGNITRAQLVLMLYKMAGKPGVTGLTCPFTDLDGLTSNNKKAIIWAYNQGIVGGTSADTFSPKNNCTRGQLVIMLYRYNRIYGLIPMSTTPSVSVEERMGSLSEA